MTQPSSELTKKMRHTALLSSALHRFFKEISANHDWAVMLGGATEPTALNQWCIMGLGAKQSAVLQANNLTINGQDEQCSDTQALFCRLEALRQQATRWPVATNALPAELPLQGGLFGAFGYGFYRWCDAGWQTQELAAPDWSDAVLCEFEDWLFVHLESAQLTVLSGSLEREAQYYQAWTQCQTVAEEKEKTPQIAPDTYLQSFTASFTPHKFEETVEQLKRDICDGEIYQANLSLQLKKQVELNPYELFERLCRRNPSPFAAFFKWPGGIIVSNSPERLTQVDAGRIVQTRPIAGTRGRGQTPDEDTEIGQTLLNNEKERAEHLMLVDLARNDLGRLCEAGSVQVDDLLVLERYSHVTHLVSNVQGQLKPEVTPWEVIASLFPGGTITGCPKIRCVEILDKVEPVSRGFYTGSLGYIDAETGALDLNILIRSVFLQVVQQTTEAPLVYNAAVHVGAGIVYDAVGAHEYRECLRKATAILNELYTLENQAKQALATLTK